MASAGGTRVGPSWLIVTYFLHVVGEMCLSPVGLSTVTKLATPQAMIRTIATTWPRVSTSIPPENAADPTAKKSSWRWLNARVYSTPSRSSRPDGAMPVPNPVAARYAWANNPVTANLYNAEGLPASPFRTDR